MPHTLRLSFQSLVSIIGYQFLESSPLFKSIVQLFFFSCSLPSVSCQLVFKLTIWMKIYVGLVLVHLKFIFQFEFQYRFLTPLVFVLIVTHQRFLVKILFFGPFILLYFLIHIVLRSSVVLNLRICLSQFLIQHIIMLLQVYCLFGQVISIHHFLIAVLVLS